jgi:hypothetical protein
MYTEINPPLAIQYHTSFLKTFFFARKKLKLSDAFLWVRNFFVLVGSGIIIPARA